MGTAETLLASHVVALVEKVSLDVKEPAGKAWPADEIQNLAQSEEQAAAKEEAPQRPEQADDECVRNFEAAINAPICAQVKAKVLSELHLLASQANGGWQTLLPSPSEKAVHENPELAEKMVKLLTDSEFPGAREAQEAVGIVDDKALDQLRTRLFQKVGESVKLTSLLTVTAARFQNPFMDAYESPHFTPRHFKAEGESGIIRATPPSGVPLPKPKNPITPPPL